MNLAPSTCLVVSLILLWRTEVTQLLPVRNRTPNEDPVFIPYPTQPAPVDPIENIGVELLQGYLIEGDIRQWHGLKSEENFQGSTSKHDTTTGNTNSHQIRNSVPDPEQTWLDRIVPYVIDPTFNDTERQIINSSIQQLALVSAENGRCLHFAEREKEEDFIYITGQLVGCWADVGRQGGNQTVSISRVSQCVTKGIIMHEIMHALGFWHEHNRPDRDQYIEIITNNVRIDHRGDFRINQNGKTTVEYDYYSIMHYKTNQFAKVSHLKTIRILKPDIDESRVGQRDGLSPKDEERIIRLYNCRKSLRSALNSSEPTTKQAKQSVTSKPVEYVKEPSTATAGKAAHPDESSFVSYEEFKTQSEDAMEGSNSDPPVNKSSRNVTGANSPKSHKL